MQLLASDIQQSTSKNVLKHSAQHEASAPNLNGMPISERHSMRHLKGKKNWPKLHSLKYYIIIGSCCLMAFSNSAICIKFTK